MNDSQERTVLIVKPDAVERQAVGAILDRAASTGLRLAYLAMMCGEPSFWRCFYRAHEGRPFFDGLVAFMASGPSVACELRGRDAVGLLRAHIGATDPRKAAPGTIRALFGDLSEGAPVWRNAAHGSDSDEAATRETTLIFSWGMPVPRVISAHGEEKVVDASGDQ